MAGDDMGNGSDADVRRQEGSEKRHPRRAANRIGGTRRGQRARFSRSALTPAGRRRCADRGAAWVAARARPSRSRRPRPVEFRIDPPSFPDQYPDRKKPSLHGRLSFTFHKEGDREQHYCFRILGHTNAIAFQSRLKAAMTASGIDTALKFRHLFILRRADPPGGPKTKAKALVDQFLKAGGKFTRARLALRRSRTAPRARRAARQAGARARYCR